MHLPTLSLALLALLAPTTTAQDSSCTVMRYADGNCQQNRIAFGTQTGPGSKCLKFKRNRVTCTQAEFTTVRGQCTYTVWSDTNCGQSGGYISRTDCRESIRSIEATPGGGSLSIDCV